MHYCEKVIYTTHVHGRDLSNSCLGVEISFSTRYLAYDPDPIHPVVT